MEDEYEFLRVLDRKNKEGKPYHLALVLFNRKDDSDLLRILVSPEQADLLVDYCSDNDTNNITSLVQIEYNSYQKAYQPKINL